MSASLLRSKLKKVKPSGRHSWIALCPAHDDRRPSLAVSEQPDGRVLVHCFAGCGINEVLDAVGLDMADLFPEKPLQHGNVVRHPFPAADVLRCLAFEILIVVLAGQRVLSGQTYSRCDQERLLLAVERIRSGANLAGVMHE